MQTSHIDHDTSILIPSVTHLPETTDSPAADELAALWLDLGGGD